MPTEPAYALLRLDRDGSLVAADRRLARMLGYDSGDELTACRGAGLALGPVERQRLVEQSDGGPLVHGIAARWPRRDGSALSLRLCGTPLRGPAGEVEGFALLAEEAGGGPGASAEPLAEGDRQAVGRLLAGVAHELSNLLVAVGWEAAALARRAEGEEAAASVGTIQDAVTRGRALIRRLFEVAGPKGDDDPWSRGPTLDESLAAVGDLLGRARQAVSGPAAPPGGGAGAGAGSTGAPEAAAPEAVSEPAAVPGLLAGRQLLLVEDEDPVRRLMAQVLTAQGAAVEALRHGEEALASLQRHPGPIDLVVTDLVMPRMGGARLAAEVARLHPEARILFVSAYSDEQDEVGSGLAAPHGFLRKPFSLDGLVSAAAKLLGGGGPRVGEVL
jgi:CheY-like chemotaxis protein